MRFALAVVTAAALDLVVLLRLEQWQAAAILALAYVLLASAGAGWFAGRRPALAGALAVFVGAVLSGLVQYWPRASYDNDLGVLVGYEVSLLVGVVPFAIGGAIAGHLGGSARSRIMRADPR